MLDSKISEFEEALIEVIKTQSVQNAANIQIIQNTLPMNANLLEEKTELHKELKSLRRG